MTLLDTAAFFFRLAQMADSLVPLSMEERKPIVEAFMGGLTKEEKIALVAVLGPAADQFKQRAK